MPPSRAVTCVNHPKREATDRFRGYDVCSFCLERGSLPWYMRQTEGDDDA